MWTRLSKLTSAFIGSKKGGSLSRSPTKNAPINDLQDENDNDVTPQKVSPPPSPPQIPSPQANANILYTKEAFTVDPITGERIEADTADSEDTLNLQTILLPSSSFPPNAKSFSVSYNKGLLDGWVKQPSPCCAAASVAGAYNGLMDLTREEAGSKGHMDVLPLMADLLKEQLKTKKSSFERLLGSSIDPLIEEVKEELRKRGRSLGGKEKNGAGEGAPNKLLLKIIREIVARKAGGHAEEEQVTGEQTRPISDGSVDETAEKIVDATADQIAGCFKALKKLYDEEAAKKSEENSNTNDGEENDENDENNDDSNENSSNENDNDNYNDNDNDQLMVFDFTSKKGKKGRPPSVAAKETKWKWKTALCEIFKKIGGISKVEADRPSTGPFGNWGIIGAVQKLSDLSPTHKFTTSLLMGKKTIGANKKSKMDFALSKRDAEAEIAKQWAGLREKFNDPNSAIIFHLKNHYALIFAIREYVLVKEEDKEREFVRQVFTARKGQRPTQWIDFSECRDTMIGWDGYKMMTVTGQKL